MFLSVARRAPRRPPAETQPPSRTRRIEPAWPARPACRRGPRPRAAVVHQVGQVRRGAQRTPSRHQRVDRHLRRRPLGHLRRASSCLPVYSLAPPLTARRSRTTKASSAVSGSRRLAPPPALPPRSPRIHICHLLVRERRHVRTGSTIRGDDAAGVHPQLLAYGNVLTSVDGLSTGCQPVDNFIWLDALKTRACGLENCRRTGLQLQVWRSSANDPSGR